MTASLWTQTSSSGGRMDTEVKEFAVMPRGEDPPAVTTVTPVANSANARRNPFMSASRRVGSGRARSRGPVTRSTRAGATERRPPVPGPVVRARESGPWPCSGPA